MEIKIYKKPTNEDELINYLELSIKQCEEFKDKWHKMGHDNTSKLFYGMHEAYCDVLDILKYIMGLK